ncbi:MAG: lipooligosaccharide transport system ATP-binding protein [bacterium]|nr:MAG: lipooligosaccharide transport system ATP-binding protein [bacterium]KAF0149782.1 MAG: lipooligosaccharide transport system ATP-binding protein [bacterium]KAF0167170.1 MAG: lipooligosaccharide transport system ATP-binding protein [bacterium]TXT17863.1 MAG: lipooligosaccharide transport system ATP-binding protein [bacterium]
MKSPLSLRGLTKSYGGQRVVDGFDLELEPGRCHGLLGPNGAGKTTTLRLALGLIEADAGTVELLGHVLPAEAKQARRRVGVVPQVDSLDPDFTVAENLQTYGRYFGLSGKTIAERIPALLDFAGLAGKADAPILTLSGGMKRRLTLARALVNDPDLIILDEPTTGLDPQARHLIWQGLRRLISQGKTLLLTTHFMDEAERLCDIISVLDHGRSIARGSPRELIAGHIEPHVVEVFGEGLDEWKACVSGLCRRCEQAGETLFCYTDNPDKVVAELEAAPGLRYLHRPANLEDVFLKITGRDLRD